MSTTGATTLPPGTHPAGETPPARDGRPYVADARWWQRAACNGMDRELFFPLGQTFAGEALAACRICPVPEDCVADALAFGDSGIRGGTTETERRYMRAGVRPSIDRTTRETKPMSEITEVTEALLDGRTVKEVSQEYDVPRQRITALINATEGWSLDARTDIVVLGGGHGDDERPAPVPAVDLSVEAKPLTPPPAPEDELESPEDEPDEDGHEPDLSNLELLLRRGENSETPATRAAAKKARAAVEDLRQRVRTEAAERQVRAKLAALQAETEAAQAQLREIRAKRTTTRSTTPAPDEPSTKEVRAWAAERGIACPARGRIPKDVQDQYVAAHSPAVTE